MSAVNTNRHYVSYVGHKRSGRALPNVSDLAMLKRKLNDFSVAELRAVEKFAKQAVERGLRDGAGGEAGSPRLGPESHGTTAADPSQPTQGYFSKRRYTSNDIAWYKDCQKKASPPPTTALRTSPGLYSNSQRGDERQAGFKDPRLEGQLLELANQNKTKPIIRHKQRHSLLQDMKPELQGPHKILAPMHGQLGHRALFKTQGPRSLQPSNWLQKAKATPEPRSTHLQPAAVQEITRILAKQSMIAPTAALGKQDTLTSLDPDDMASILALDSTVLRLTEHQLLEM